MVPEADIAFLQPLSTGNYCEKKEKINNFVIITCQNMTHDGIPIKLAIS
jgi:hypothetical protein